MPCLNNPRPRIGAFLAADHFKLMGETY